MIRVFSLEMSLVMVIKIKIKRCCGDYRIGGNRGDFAGWRCRDLRRESQHVDEEILVHVPAIIRSLLIFIVKPKCVYMIVMKEVKREMVKGTLPVDSLSRGITPIVASVLQSKAQHLLFVTK